MVSFKVEALLLLWTNCFHVQCDCLLYDVDSYTVQLRVRVLCHYLEREREGGGGGGGEREREREGGEGGRGGERGKQY